MKQRHTRNPIRRHGTGPSSEFTQIPNELARDAKLGLHAYRVAIVLRSHKDGWEVSAKSIAEQHGWHRDTVGRALRELVQERWLAITSYRTYTGARLYDEYHVHAARRFTEDEMAQLNLEQTINAEPESPRDRQPVQHDTADEYLPDKCSECFWHKRSCGVTRDIDPFHAGQVADRLDDLVPF